MIRCSLSDMIGKNMIKIVMRWDLINYIKYDKIGFDNIKYDRIKYDK